MKPVLDFLLALPRSSELSKNEVILALANQGWVLDLQSPSPAEEWQKGEFSAFLSFNGEEFPVSILIWQEEPTQGGRGDYGLDSLYDRATEVVDRFYLSLQERLQEEGEFEHSKSQFSDLDYFSYHTWRLGTRSIHLGAIQFDTDLPVIVEVYVA